MKALLLHPPTGLYLRQDRCQTLVENKSAMEPPNELGYIAALLESSGIECKIQDYPMLSAKPTQYINDIKIFHPDIVIIAATAFTIEDDIDFCRMAKQQYNNIISIIKTPYLSPEEATDLMRKFGTIDVILLREYEYSIKELAECLKHNNSIHQVKGIVVRHKGIPEFAGEREFIEDLDRLPFPARHLFNNKLYIRPDTGQPQATIQTARGCPFQCIFCLASELEGHAVRKRSPANIIAEIKECIDKYNIKNFFFRADTFTLDKQWVIDLCTLIVQEDLRIEWVCNSRVDTLDEELIKWMKRAGCWLVSLGIESGNQEMLNKMKKGTTIEDAKKTVRLCKDHGIKTYCFFILGLPWDNMDTIGDTINLALQLNGTFFLFHTAMPFKGTELYKIAKENKLIENDSLFKSNHFKPCLKTFYLTENQVQQMWKKANWKMYTNPLYIKQILSSIHSAKELVNYLSYGCGKIKQLLLG